MTTIHDIPVIETDVLVIGGGTAGPMAAVTVKEQDPTLKVLLLEKAFAKLRGSYWAIGDGGQPGFLQEGGRRPHPDDSGNIRGSGLKAKRRFSEGRALEGDGANHVAASLPGRHGLQVLGLSPQRAGPSGAVHLVA